VKRMKAQLHLSDGSAGQRTLKIKCEADGHIISADSCRLRYCSGSKGFKEYFDEEGKECVEVLCGFDEIAKGG